jgi:hypothetical protein
MDDEDWEECDDYTMEQDMENVVCALLRAMVEEKEDEQEVEA